MASRELTMVKMLKRFLVLPYVDVKIIFSLFRTPSEILLLINMPAWVFVFFFLAQVLHFFVPQLWLSAVVHLACEFR